MTTARVISSMPKDLVERLLLLPYLPLSLYRQHIGHTAREAAEFIQRARSTAPADERRIDWQSREIVADGERRPLSPQEFMLLRQLVKAAGKPVSTRELVRNLTEHRRDGGSDRVENLARVLMCNLRRKSPWPIRSRQGHGYMLEGYEGELSETVAKALPQAAPGVSMPRLMAGR